MASSERAGRRTSTRYDLIEERGRGGIGRVIEAYDSELDRFVALKELHHVSTLSEARFVREAKITARLEHPSIVPVHEMGRWSDGTPYYAMKLVAGRSLKQLIKSSETFEQRLGLVQNVLSVAEAIGYAHSERIIHRDLKPSNVVVGEHGETIVIDWGLAKDLTDSQADADELGSPYRVSGREGLTVTGAVMGTPAYMAPEQARGEEVDARADVYAVGAMLYQVLSGTLPYEGESSDEILRQVLARAPRPLAERVANLPAELVAIVNKAMARDADERYPSARELADDLRRFQTGRLVSAHHYTAATLLRRWLRRHRVAVTVAAVLGVVGAAYGGWSINRIIAARRDAEVAQAKAERERNELILANARNAIRTDPTSAIGWLKLYAGSEWKRVRDISATAVAHGVAWRVLHGHQGGLLSVAALDRTGSRIVSHGYDHTVRVWDASSGSYTILDNARAELEVEVSADAALVALRGTQDDVVVYATDASRRWHLRGHSGLIYDVAFDPRGERVVTAGADGSIRLWRLPSGSLEKTLRGESAVYRAQLSPNGRVLASCDSDRVLALWSLDEGKASRLGACNAASEIGSTVVFSRDGGLLATAAAEGDVVVWSVAERTSRVLAGANGGSAELAFSPDERYLANASFDGNLYVWSVASGKLLHKQQHHAPLYRVAFSPDGTFVAGADEHGTVKITWLSTMVDVTLDGHAGAIWTMDISADSRRVITGGQDGEIRVWPRPRFAPESSSERAASRILSVSYDRTGRVAASSRDGSILLWNPDEGSTRVLASGASTSGVPARFTADGSGVVFAPEPGCIATWELAHDQLVPMTCTLDLASGLAVAEDNTAATGDRRGVVQIFETTTGRTLNRVATNSPALDVQTLPGRPAFVSTHQDGSMWLHTAGAESRQLASGEPAALQQVAVATRATVTLGADGSVRRWNLEDGDSNVLATTRGGPATIRVSSDGSVVAIAEDSTVRIVDLDGVQPDTVLSSVSGEIKDASFSPDGRLIAVAAIDGSISVWDRDTGRAIVLRGHDRQASRIVFSPDSNILVSGGRDGRLLQWALPDSDEIDWIPGEETELVRWLGQTTNATPPTQDKGEFVR